MPSKPLLSLFLLAALPVAAQDLPAWRLQAIEGTVQARAGDWRPAEAGSTLLPGASLRTGGDGRAFAALPGGALVLDSGSNLDLVRLDTATQLILARGTLAVALQEPVAVSIATPRGVASLAAPGRYLVEAGDAVRPARLSVFDGAARLITEAGSTEAGPGQVAWVALDDMTRLGQAGHGAHLVDRLLDPPRPAPAPATEAPALVAALPAAEPAAVPVAARPAAPPTVVARTAAIGRTETARSSARIADATPPRPRSTPRSARTQTRHAAATAPRTTRPPQATSPRS